MLNKEKEELLRLYDPLPDIDGPCKVIFIDDEWPHPPIHWHSNVEINYFVDGGFNATLEGENFYVENDSVILVNSEAPHFFGEYPLGEQQGITLVVSEQFMYRACPDFGLRRLSLDYAPDRVEILKGYCRELFEMYRNCAPEKRRSEVPFEAYQMLKIRGLLNLICYEMIEYFSRIEDQDFRNNLGQSLHWIQDAITYINENYASDLTLQLVADQCCISREHFSRTFHKKVGMKFREYLMRMRLQHACNMLIYTNEQVLNIAVNTGFQGLRGFNRQFKEVFNITPMEYRKALKKKLNVL